MDRHMGKVKAYLASEKRCSTYIGQAGNNYSGKGRSSQEKVLSQFL